MLPFLTAFDPLGGTSGSVDPLGALQAYGALADLLLPGVSTVTTRSRYLAVICRALHNAETRRDLPPGAAGLNERRKAVEPFERLWALACVAARDKGHEGAVDRLRGITYAERAYQDFTRRGDKVSPDFKLLKYQGRTGAVGTYWTAMVGGGLVDPDSGRLMPEGVELAETFPQPPLADRELNRLSRPDEAHRVSLPVGDLCRWAEQSHLAAATPEEKRLLADALTQDERRDCLAQALGELRRAGALPDGWDLPWLVRLGKKLQSDERALRLGLPEVVQAVVAAERFHEAALAVFGCLLWWGTTRPGDPVEHLLAEEVFKRAADQARQTARGFVEFRGACERAEVRRAIDSLAPYAQAVDRGTTARHVMDETISRHHRVQSGKASGGVPKRDWVAFDANRLLRPSPRYQVAEPPAAPRGDVLTHPYRLEPFVGMLRENDALAA
jgi:hypothetical protein